MSLHSLVLGIFVGLVIAGADGMSMSGGSGSLEDTMSLLPTDHGFFETEQGQGRPWGKEEESKDKDSGWMSHARCIWRRKLNMDFGKRSGLNSFGGLGMGDYFLLRGRGRKEAAPGATQEKEETPLMVHHISAI